LYEYCRLIVHSFGHKAELNDSAPQMKPSTYIATVRTPLVRRASISSHLIVVCNTVYGSCPRVARFVVELYAFHWARAICARLFLRWDRLCRCLPHRGLFPSLSLPSSSLAPDLDAVISFSGHILLRHCQPKSARA
jgi:hypothetical protein